MVLLPLLEKLSELIEFFDFFLFASSRFTAESKSTGVNEPDSFDESLDVNEITDGLATVSSSFKLLFKSILPL